MTSSESRGRVISEVEQQLRARRDELQPAVDEYREIERLLASFARRGSASRSQLGSRRGRRGGTRSEQAVRLIHERPGIGVGELASVMGIGPTYLYKLLPGLERDGLVEKHETGYRALTDAPPD